MTEAGASDGRIEHCAAGLSVGTVSSASSGTVPVGAVISQNPVACSACAQGGDPAPERR